MLSRVFYGTDQAVNLRTVIRCHGLPIEGHQCLGLFLRGQKQRTFIFTWLPFPFANDRSSVRFQVPFPALLENAAAVGSHRLDKEHFKAFVEVAFDGNKRGALAGQQHAIHYIQQLHERE